MSLFSLSSDVVHLVLEHLKLTDKVTLRTVCKEAKQTVDFDSVQHLHVDKAALVTEDAPEASQVLRQWPSPATLQMWGKSVRELTVGNEAGVHERLQWLLQSGASMPGVPFSEDPASAWWFWLHNGQAEDEQEDDFEFFGLEGDEGLEWQGEAQPGVLPAQPGVPPTQPGTPPAGTFPAQPVAPPAELEMTPSQQGIPAQPGVPPTQVGMLPVQHGVVPIQPGVPPTQVGILPAQPGAPPAELEMTPAQPGIPPAQPGVPPTQVGMLPAQPGVPPAQPSEPPAQPGSTIPAQLGVPPAEPGMTPTQLGVQPIQPGVPPAHLGLLPAQPGAPPAQPGEPPTQAGVTSAQHGVLPVVVHGVNGHGASTSGHAGAMGLGVAGQGAIPSQATGSAAATGQEALPAQGAAAPAAASVNTSGHQGVQVLRLPKLPTLCSRLPHLSALRLWGLELSLQDFAAAAVHCPQLTSLEYLAPPPTARQLSPQGLLLPRRVGWDGGLWAHLSLFPSLRHLTLKGWCFAGSEGLLIGLLTGLRRLEIENCTNQSSDGVGLSNISLLTNLSHLTFSRIRYPHPIPSEFSGLSAIKGLSSLTAIDGDFFPEEILAWAEMHFTRLTLSSSYNLTLHGMAVLVPQLKSLVVLEVPDLMLDLRMARGLMQMPSLRELCVAWIHIRPQHPVSQHLELPQVQHLALQNAYEYDVRWEGSIGAVLPNIQSLELVARVDVERACTLGVTLFEKPLPALTTLIASATFLTAPEVAAACPAVTSLGIIEPKDWPVCIPQEWRRNITRLALAGSDSSNLSQYLGRQGLFHNLQELALLAFTEGDKTDWLADYSDLECGHLKAITLALCPDMGPLHLYCLASQSPYLEEMRVFRCPKVTPKQCQRMVGSLLSQPVVGAFSSPEIMSEAGCGYAAWQQAAEALRIADVEASDEHAWKHFHSRIVQSTGARLRSVPFDIVCRDAGSDDALLHRVEGRHILASLAWRAVSSHSYYKSSA